MKRILFATLFLVTIFFAFVTKEAKASQGFIELRSTTGTTTRCLATSMPTLGTRGLFDISVDCRDLIYPADGDKRHYVMWANPVGGVAAQRLGTLGFGKAFFVPNYEFGSLFVTVESIENPRSPEGRVVMQGGVQKYTFLDNPGTATPALEEDDSDTTTVVGTEVTPTSSPNRVMTGLKRAGIISVLALVALFGLIFVITRGR